MKSITDQQNMEKGKVVKFGPSQITNPTPAVAKMVFRVFLYLSALWAVLAPSITEIPAETLDVINRWMLIANAILNVTVRFWGWDFENAEAQSNYYTGRR